MRSRRLADAAQQARQVPEDGGYAHQGDVGRIEEAAQPVRFEVAAADADEVDGSSGGPCQRRGRGRRRAGRRIPRRQPRRS
jgi:hypothetical protein